MFLFYRFEMFVILNRKMKSIQIKSTMIFSYLFCRYFLRPQSDLKLSSCDLGSLRLKISYDTEHVFASHHYDDLLNLILESSSIEVL